MRSNCVIWALAAYREHHATWVECGRIKGREPALRLRPSRLEPRWVLHLQVERYSHEDGGLVLEQWVPNDPTPLRWWTLWRALWCEGHIKRGDFPETETEGLT